MPRVEPPDAHFVLFHGISLTRKEGWSDRLRRRVGVPKDLWHELNYDDLLSAGSMKTLGRYCQRQFWRTGGDATKYWRPARPPQTETVSQQVVRHCLAEIGTIPHGAPVNIAAHSWGTVVAWETLMQVQAIAGKDTWPLRRIVWMGSALGDDPPETLFETTHGQYNLRARLCWECMGLWPFCDPVSLSLASCKPRPKEEWVFGMHSTLWRSQRLVHLLREVK